MNQFIDPYNLLFMSARIGNMEGILAGLKNIRMDRYTLLVTYMTAKCFHHKEIEAFLFGLLEKGTQKDIEKFSLPK